MTGNVTQIVIDLVDLALGHVAYDPGRRFANMVPALLAFVAGGLAAAIAYSLVGFWCVAVPIAVPLFMNLGGETRA